MSESGSDLDQLLRYSPQSVLGWTFPLCMVNRSFLDDPIAVKGPKQTAGAQSLSSTSFREMASCPLARRGKAPIKYTLKKFSTKVQRKEEACTLLFIVYIHELHT